MTKYEQLNNMLEKIKEDEYKIRNHFANLCYKKLIIPICKEHNINFQCSMGVWNFEDIKQIEIEKDDLRIKEIADFLEHTFFDNQSPLYYYLDSYIIK